MANEYLSSQIQVEDSPDISVINPVIEIGYITSEIQVEEKIEIPVINPVVEIGYVTSMMHVEGMPDEYKRNFIANDTVSVSNGTKQTGIYIDENGEILIPIQSNIPNNQLGS